MLHIELSRRPIVLFLFVCLLTIAFLGLSVDRVQADPCTTPGVVCVNANITVNTTWYANTIYYVTKDIHVISGNTLTI